MELNEEKRLKFMENAGKRVNKVMHDIQILEPMYGGQGKQGLGYIR